MLYIASSVNSAYAAKLISWYLQTDSTDVLKGRELATEAKTAEAAISRAKEKNMVMKLGLRKRLYNKNLKKLLSSSALAGMGPLSSFSPKNGRAQGGLE